MSQDTIAIGSAILQLDRQLLKGGERVALGPRALAILSMLARSRGEIVSKDELFGEIWPDTTVEENALQVHVTAVRKALGEDADLLETVRGIGYKLHLEASEIAPPSGEAVMEQGAAESTPATDQDAKTPPPLSKPNRKLVTASWLGLAGAIALGAFLWQGSVSDSGDSLCVLPLEASGQDDQARALASGISNELIGRLRRIDGLSVVTSSSEDECRTTTLKGSVQVNDDQMRLVARLESAGGEVSWSESFDREVDDVFAIQNEISYEVSRALSVPLDIGIEARRYGGTDSPEAYANYVRGRAYRHEADHSLPVLHLERALALDPDYVKALTELTFADGLSLYSERDPGEAARLKERMDRNSSKALEIAPELWHSHAARAWFLIMNKDFLGAERAHRRMMELDPGNDPELLNSLANYEAQLGRQAAVRRLRASRASVDPIYSAEATPADYYMNSEFDRAIALQESGVDASPLEVDSGLGIWFYWALRLSGKIEQARDDALQRFGDNPALSFFSTMDYGGAFQDQPLPILREQAQQLLGAGGRGDLAELAKHASQKGNHRLAMDYLRLAFDERDAMGGYFVLWDPALASTRRTPEFAEWLVALGIVEAWRESGDWGDYCRPMGPDSITCE